MNKLILAATLALSAVVAIPATSFAETVVIRSDNGMHRGDHYRGHHYRTVREDRRKHCMTKKVTTFRHGERVTRVTKVCR